jgi:hypothetical protein
MLQGIQIDLVFFDLPIPFPLTSGNVGLVQLLGLGLTGAKPANRSPPQAERDKEAHGGNLQNCRINHAQA